MLLFLHPLLITIFFAITKIKHMNYQNYIAIFLALIGSMTVLDLLFIKLEEISLFGIYLGLMAAVCYAFYNVFADLKLKEIEANSINLFGSLFGSLFTLVVIFVSNTPFSVSISNMPSIFLLSSLSGILPVYFIFKSLKHIGSERVSVIMTLELPMTFLIAYIVFGDLIKVRQMGGIALIIFSTMLLHYQGKIEREDKNNEIGGL
jgi:drug/metabolite transporter (DMT)-like permease